VEDLPLDLYCKLLRTTLRGQNLILGCNRQYLRQPLSPFFLGAKVTIRLAAAFLLPRTIGRFRVA
jgi:hypothetical protein